MDFVLKEHNNLCIIKPLKEELNTLFLYNLEDFIQFGNKNKKRTARDCKNVKNICDYKTVEFLTKNAVAIFNLDPQVAAQASLLDSKNFIDLYLNENDFIEDKRKLTRRRLRLV